MRIIMIFLIILTHWSIFAAGLTAPFSMGSTQVLPKGVRSLRVGGLTTAVDNWYNNEGATSGVAEPFDQQLTYRRLLKAERDDNLKLNVESQLKNKKVSMDEIAGRSFADVNTRVTVTMPAFAYGVTENWTLAAVVPIVYSNMSVATSYTGTEQLQGLVDSFAKKSRSQTEIIRQKLSDVIRTEISNKNYKPLVSEEKTEVGDLTLVSKYLLFKGLAMTWALTNTLSVPTGRDRDASKVIDVNPGDGQWDFGSISTLQVPMGNGWTVIHQLGYIFQFSDSQDTRIPMSINERLSVDYDPAAHRDIGDKMFSNLGFQYAPLSILNLGMTYQLSYKERDFWRGSKVEAHRYDVLGHETEQFMEAAYFNIGLTSVSAYKNGHFPIPMVANIGYAQIINGRNVRNAPLWNLSMAMFF